MRALFADTDDMMGHIDYSNVKSCLSRVTLAMFGFLPQYVDDSLKNLLLYNALPVEIKFDSKGAKQTNMQMVKYNFVSWVKYLLILGLYSSLLQAFDYEPYPKEEGPALQDIKLGTGFSRGQLINNMLTACKCEKNRFRVNAFMGCLLTVRHFPRSTIPDISDDLRFRPWLHSIVDWSSTCSIHA